MNGKSALAANTYNILSQITLKQFIRFLDPSPDTHDRQNHIKVNLVANAQLHEMGQEWHERAAAAANIPNYSRIASIWLSWDPKTPPTRAPALE